MNPEINTLLLLGLPTATGISGYFMTQKSFAARGRQLVLENRFDKLITQGIIERTVTPAAIWFTSMTAAIVIGETAPLNPESFLHLLGAMSAFSMMFGSTLGSMVSGSAKINLGRYLKLSNPNAQPRTVIDGSAVDVIEDHSELTKKNLRDKF
jgi:hypothetical protein